MDEITELFKPVVYKVVQLCANKYGFDFIEAIQYIEESNSQNKTKEQSKKPKQKNETSEPTKQIKPQKPRKLKLVVGKQTVDRIINHTSVLGETARKEEIEIEEKEIEEKEHVPPEQQEEQSTKQKEEEPTKVEIVKYNDAEYYVMEGTNYAYTTDTEMYVGIYNWSTKSIEY